MRTNIVLDDRLVKKAFRVSYAQTKKDLIHEALTEYVQHHNRLNIGDIKGKIKFSKGYNYKKLRAGA